MFFAHFPLWRHGKSSGEISRVNPIPSCLTTLSAYACNGSHISFHQDTSFPLIPVCYLGLKVILYHIEIDCTRVGVLDDDGPRFLLTRVDLSTAWEWSQWQWPPLEDSSNATQENHSWVETVRATPSTLRDYLPPLSKILSCGIDSE